MLGRACSCFPVLDYDMPTVCVSSLFFYSLEGHRFITCACRTKWTMGATMLKSARSISCSSTRYQLTDDCLSRCYESKNVLQEIYMTKTRN